MANDNNGPESYDSAVLTVQSPSAPIMSSPVASFKIKPTCPASIQLFIDRKLALPTVDYTRDNDDITLVVPMQGSTEVVVIDNSNGETYWRWTAIDGELEA